MQKTQAAHTPQLQWPQAKELQVTVSACIRNALGRPGSELLQNEWKVK